MGFFKDLFGPRQPCDLCHLGQGSWPADRSASADWKIRGHGLQARLFICVPCRRFVMESDLMEKTPMLAVAHLVKAGHARRPPLHAYLLHPEWMKIWMHSLDSAGIEVSVKFAASDTFAALSAMKSIEAGFMKAAGVSTES